MKQTTWVFGVAAFLASTVAQADLLPPGLQSVEYSFRVAGIPAGTDLVMLAYPCSTSNGRPSGIARKVEDNQPLIVGRRGGECTLYVVPKASYTAFMAKYKPADSYEDKPLADFMAKATKCKGAPSLTFFVPEKDPRKSIDETLTVKTMTATACELELKSANTLAASASPPVTSASAAASGAPSSSAAPVSAPAVASTSPSAPASKGCHAAPSGPAGYGGFAWGLVALVAAWRRRRSRTAH